MNEHKTNASNEKSAENLASFAQENELPRRKQRGILKSIERPKGRGIKPREIKPAPAANGKMSGLHLKQKLGIRLTTGDTINASA